MTTNPNIQRGRWRGRMPFRQSLAVRDLLIQQRRTGEPSPSSNLQSFFSVYRELLAMHRQGDGKADGSYTGKVRKALQDWVETNTGSWIGPLTFEYRISRKQTVLVTGTYPYIKHNPLWGAGQRGFVLELYAGSIDGAVPTGARIRSFAFNRIVGQSALKALMSPPDTLRGGIQCQNS